MPHPTPPHPCLHAHNGTHRDESTYLASSHERNHMPHPTPTHPPNVHENARPDKDRAPTNPIYLYIHIYIYLYKYTYIYIYDICVICVCCVQRSFVGHDVHQRHSCQAGHHQRGGASLFGSCHCRRICRFQLSWLRCGRHSWLLDGLASTCIIIPHLPIFEMIPNDSKWSIVILSENSSRVSQAQAAAAPVSKDLGGHTKFRARRATSAKLIPRKTCFLRMPMSLPVVWLESWEPVSLSCWAYLWVILRSNLQCRNSDQNSSIR